LALISAARCAAQSGSGATNSREQYAQIPSDYNLSIHGYPEDLSILEAVREFNTRAQQDAIGKTQPSLTVPEVVAALLAMDSSSKEMPRREFEVFQWIAQTGVIPKGSLIRFIPKLVAVNGYDIDVWWIHLQIGLDKYPADLVDAPMYVCRIRTTYISSRRHTRSG
jgi:hypothetical protein